MYDVKDSANREEVLAKAQEWTDWDVTARACKFVRGLKAELSKEAAR